VEFSIFKIFLKFFLKFLIFFIILKKFVTCHVMVLPCVNLIIFFLILIILILKKSVTRHITIVPRVKLTLIVFNLVPLFTIWIQFSPPIFLNDSILSSLI